MTDTAPTGAPTTTAGPPPARLYTRRDVQAAIFRGCPEADAHTLPWSVLRQILWWKANAAENLGHRDATTPYYTRALAAIDAVIAAPAPAGIEPVAQEGDPLALAVHMIDEAHRALAQRGGMLTPGPDAPDGISALTRALDEVASLRGELDRAQATIADMHAAALGARGLSPVRGLVEDVADIRARMLDAEARLAEREGERR